MTTVRTTPVRYDAALRSVIAADAVGSAVAAVAGAAAPVVALVPVTRGAGVVIGLVAIVAALVLAALGAVTAVLFVLRMRAGHGEIPSGLRLPLPAAMVPEIVRARPVGRRPAEVGSAEVGEGLDRRVACDHTAS